MHNRSAAAARRLLGFSGQVRARDRCMVTGQFSGARGRRVRGQGQREAPLGTGHGQETSLGTDRRHQTRDRRAVLGATD